MNDVDVAIRIVSEAAGTGFDATTAAARSMGDGVSAAADQAAGGMDRVAGAAEGLDDKNGKLAGGLGALSSGFELVGLGNYAAGLQGAAMAADAASGVGQLLSLALELESLQRVKAVATTTAHRVAVVASAAAARTAAIAQAALNAVLAANPIALVVLAVVALVAIFVVLYQRNETVRNAIQAAMAVARAAIGFVVSKVSELVGWLVDRAGPGFEALRATAVLVMGAIREKVGPVFDTVREVFGRIQTTIGDVLEAASSKFTWLKDQAGNALQLMLAPVFAVRDAVQNVIDLIGRIKVPKFDLPGGAFTSSAAAPVAAAPAAPILIQITVDPSTSLLDPTTLGQQLATTVADALTRLGRETVVA